MRILITGGAGFIGSHLTEHLLDDKRVTVVRVLDNLATGSQENINLFSANPKFEFFRGDIRDYSTCLAACNGMDIISHQAALGSVPRSINDPLTTNEVNITGTLNIFTAAKEKGMILVVSAGNEGENNKWQQLISTPADSEFTIAVGANDESGLKMSYSSIGPSGLKYTKPNLSCFSKFGTSLAAPVITGLIAILLEKEGSLSLNEINKRLFKSSLLYPFDNNYLGYGYPESKYLINNHTVMLLAAHSPIFFSHTTFFNGIMINE